MSSSSKSEPLISQDVIAAFEASKIDYAYRSIHIWEEHCTECAFPACYKTCDLYEPRKDGNCRRFKEGAVRIRGIESVGGPVVEITFKRWANMFSKGSCTLLSLAEAKRIEDRTQLWSDILRKVPDGGIRVNGWPGPFTRIAKRLRLRTRDKKTKCSNKKILPEKFLIELFVPGEKTFDSTLSISADASKVQQIYQKRLILEPGYNKIEISISEISAIIGKEEANFISMIPNTETNTARKIYLGFMGFVSSGEAQYAKPSKSIKIMVWDLDNTMWDGILVEDGVDKLTLKSGITEIIKTLDRRGIINSIASKNDLEPAIEALKKFGLEEYFVFPQISWAPKSQALKKIVDDFNIGANTVAFIDDQIFERSEVMSVLPEVRTYDAEDYKNILTRPEFNPEISSESASRRLQYINESERRELKSTYDGTEYESFLNDCKLQMQILQGDHQNIDRIYELTQRTNQMNFSGTRYTREDIESIFENPKLNTFSLLCQDKFGDYGTVGFGLVALPENPDDNPQVIDLAFSCRIQSKRVEHTFIAWLCKKYQAQGMTKLEVRYIPTPRNKATAVVFDDMGFSISERGTFDECKIMVIDVDSANPDIFPWNITHEDHSSSEIGGIK